ncbi:lipoprotein transmembrane [Altererythrobacter sp. B11]|uniref:DUF4136 domain-containing protein n=1 Tax=Altererythrobacter sp. B11 TaxID=2060312 RepID=UPI000DC709DF|nr:DUF4136 domain-containing protein [Altererythrobacter sp. B11]BBC74448.1 lipoprotein transmembrane [Altererythrobacter sp. B11]
MSNFTNVARGLKLAVVTLALATLAACASSFNADVSRFQSQLPAPAGQTFAVVAEDPSLAGGLEFSQYASYVSAQMQELGYTPGSPDTANLIVRFDYGVDKGRERVTSTGFGYRDPFYSPWYGYQPIVYRGRNGRPYVSYVPTRAWGYGWYDPFFGGGYNDVSSYTIYTSEIDLKIDQRATGQRLFEGKAEAVSTSNRLQYLVPNLVEAMFTDFPGNSGETVRISIKPENQPVKRSSR